jgi:NAD(P)H dehydrogenase (quinone)
LKEEQQMNVLIVYAHPEPKSFNGALRDLAVSRLRTQGHRVQVSNPYEMDFNPIGGRHDFTVLENPGYFKYGVEQIAATEKKRFAPDVASEQKRLSDADLLIFQFPIWWFGLPAILNGWVDRVFACSLTYGAGRWYSNGVFKGRRAMLSLTTGGPDTLYSPTGLNGDINDILFSIQRGMLYFVGFDVLPPFVAWAPAHVSQERRLDYLKTNEQRLRSIETTSPIQFHSLTDYNKSLQLKRKS